MLGDCQFRYKCVRRVVLGFVQVPNIFLLLSGTLAHFWTTAFLVAGVSKQ
jgi:hypothetical protein